MPNQVARILAADSFWPNVRRLRDEAAEAGDLEQVAVCARALRGDFVAAGECALVLADAEAQS